MAGSGERARGGGKRRQDALQGGREGAPGGAALGGPAVGKMDLRREVFRARPIGEIVMDDQVGSRALEERGDRAPGLAPVASGGQLEGDNPDRLVAAAGP